MNNTIELCARAFDTEASKWEVRGWGVRWAVWPAQPGAIGDLPVDATGMIHTFASKEAAVSFKLGLVMTAVLAAAEAVRPVLGYQSRFLPHGGKPTNWNACTEDDYNRITTNNYQGSKAEARRIYGEIK